MTKFISLFAVSQTSPAVLPSSSVQPALCFFLPVFS
jgi:hypothetical protein